MRRVVAISDKAFSFPANGDEDIVGSSHAVPGCKGTRAYARKNHQVLERGDSMDLFEMSSCWFLVIYFYLFVH